MSVFPFCLSFIFFLSSFFFFFFFFFNDTATTEIYTLSLHDALPIYLRLEPSVRPGRNARDGDDVDGPRPLMAGNGAIFQSDRKSTRLNSSHPSISYAVFCLKKKKKKETNNHNTSQTTHRLHQTTQ